MSMILINRAKAEHLISVYITNYHVSAKYAVRYFVNSFEGVVACGYEQVAN